MTHQRRTGQHPALKGNTATPICWRRSTPTSLVAARHTQRYRIQNTVKVCTWQSVTVFTTPSATVNLDISEVDSHMYRCSLFWETWPHSYILWQTTVVVYRLVLFTVGQQGSRASRAVHMYNNGRISTSDTYTWPICIWPIRWLTWILNRICSAFYWAYHWPIACKFTSTTCSVTLVHLKHYCTRLQSCNTFAVYQDCVK